MGDRVDVFKTKAMYRTHQGSHYKNKLIKLSDFWIIEQRVFVYVTQSLSTVFPLNLFSNVLSVSFEMN